MKRLTKSITTAFIILLILGLSGCSSDVVDEHLYSSIGVDGFYRSEGEVDLALNGVYGRMTDEGFYRALMMTVLGDVPGGVLRGGAESNGSGDKSNDNTQWNEFTWTSDAHEPSSIWDVHYDGINRANTLISKLPNSDITDSQRKWYEGQAKFLRAYFYFDLVRIFGGVPLIVEPTLDLSDVEKPRSSIEEVYQQIINDLNDAETMLSPYKESDHSMGRATSAAAKALLAKVYLQQKDWANAAAKAKEVMDMGAYGLYADYHDIFRPANSTGKEMIFAIQRGGEANASGSFYFAKAVYLWGPPPTTLSDGTSVKFNDVKFPITLQVNRDFYDSTPDTYRKQETMTDVMPYYYVGSQLVQNSVTLYAPFLIKFHYVDFGSGVLNQGVCTPLIRYSDMLLTYAEAENESNGGPTVGAYDAINQVRERARAVGTPNEQSPTVYPDLAGLSQAQFRDSVLVERAREFVGEGLRRDDLLRQGKYISNAIQRGISADDHHKVFPLPGDALSVNPNLEQNKGY